MSIYTSLLTLLWAKYPNLALDFCRFVSGEIFSVELSSGQKLVIVSAPAHVEQLFKSSAVAGNEELRPYLGDGSLFLRKGSEHAEARRWTRAGVVSAVSPTNFARHIAAAAAKASDAKACDPYPFFRAAALKSIIEACFGTLQPTDHLTDLIERLFSEMTAYRLFSYDGVITDEGPAKALRDVRTELAALINRSVEPGSGVIFATRARDRAPTHEQAVDDVLTFIAAGAEPLAATLCWVLYFLARDRSLADRVDTELATWCPHDDELQSEPPFSAAVIKEALRLMPVVPVVDRVISSPTRIGDRMFHDGDRVAACAYLTHRRADVFSDPGVFRPDRFLSGSRSPYEYYPFGGGTRRCIGASTASRILPAGLRAFRLAFHFRPISRPTPTMYNVIVAPRARALITPLAGSVH